MDTSTRTFRPHGQAAAFGRAGFRKWYERQLLTGHAHMVLAFLSVIGLIASFEAFGAAPPQEKAGNVLFVVVCAAVSLWALRRYLFLLARAEYAANQASCPQCGDYGRFQVIGDGASHADTNVACRRCQHPWTISSLND